EALFVTVRPGGSRTECWIRRESLDRWIAARDAELTRYMPRSEAVPTLGLKNTTLVRVAAAGAMRYVEGPGQNFPAGFFFLREDVVAIDEAFERHTVPLMEYSKPADLIALRHAVKNYLGYSGLAVVIRAVIDGSIAPVGYAKRF